MPTIKKIIQKTKLLFLVAVSIFAVLIMGAWLDEEQIPATAHYVSLNDR